jgi:hypothetical protein
LETWNRAGRILTGLMSKWMIMVPLVLVLAGCNGSLDRDLASCKLEALHDASRVVQTTHVALCMQARGWRFTVEPPRCMAIEHQLQSDRYESDSSHRLKQWVK